jgi:hypothetical protein
MQLGKAAADQILTIVHLLAKGADHQRLSPMNTQALNQNVEALIQHDGDDFVRAFLARVRDATGVLTPLDGSERNRACDSQVRTGHGTGSGANLPYALPALVTARPDG